MTKFHGFVMRKNEKRLIRAALDDAPSRRRL